MEKKYIKPQIIQANKVAGINEYLNKPEYMEPTKKCEYKRINFEDIPNYHRLIVLGEPGCGKTELTRQLTSQVDSCKISLLESTKSDISIPDGTTLICFDALDEVSIGEFSSAIKLIAQIAQNHPSIRIIVTCRTHYINSNISLILASLSSFQYILIDKFDEDKIKAYIDSTDLNESLKQMLQNKLNSDSNKQLKKILQIPRYLTELCTVIKESEIPSDELDAWKRADFFEKAIYYKLEKEIKSTNELHISQRMLEKLALIMEIKRENRVSIDDFLSFVDETDSNISHVFLSTINLSKFYDRTLKKTGNYLEFDNTEFQEYLAAKEILRHSNKYQIIYDLLIDKDFEHIYSNWYDVLRFIVELSPDILLPLSKYIMLGNNSWTDEEFFRLVKEADPEKLNNNQKAQLFETIYTYFQSHGLYLHDYFQLLLSLYTPESARFFDLVIDEIENVDYHFRIYNQFKIVTELIRNSQLTNKIEYWDKLFKEFAVKDSSPLQCAALYAMLDLKREDSLLSFNNCSAITSNTKTYEVYLNALRNVCPNNDISISHFKRGMKAGKREAIMGLMNITKADKFIPIFTEIFNSEENTKFFFSRNANVFGYYSLVDTMGNLWDKYEDIRKIASLILNTSIRNKNYESRYALEEFLRNVIVLFKKKNNELVFEIIDQVDDYWDLRFNRWILQTAICAGQLSSLNKKMVKKYGKSNGEFLTLNLLKDISTKMSHRNKEAGSIYEEGRTLFPDKYLEWESPTIHKDLDLEQFIRNVIPKLESINTLDIDSCFNLLEELNRNHGLKYLYIIDDTNRAKLTEVILNALEYIDFDEIFINRNEHGSVTYSVLIYIFDFALTIGCKLDLQEHIKTRFRKKIICYLPIGLVRINFDSAGNEIDLIGTLSIEEENFLYEFISSRKDEYLTFQPVALFENIRMFKLKNLKGFLEQFISKSVEDYYMNDALELLSEEFMNENEDFFFQLWKSVTPSTISKGSKYEIANALLVSKYNNHDAASWRFIYLKNNIYEFSLYDFKGTRGVSSGEAEMDSPSFCNCFIESKRPNYVEHFFDLIDFSLTLNTELKYKKYSEYLQTMSIEYFKVLGNRDIVIELRKRANNHQNKKAAEEFRRLLKELELFYVNKETNINIYQAISQYNKIKANKYEMISNSTDLYEVVQRAINDFVNTIENEGLYRPINYLSSAKYPNEDLLQKTLKLSLENSLYKYGVREIDIIREANLYDDKRTDIIVKYGFIGPIMIELKLLDNTEVQNKTEMVEYKKKLNQYIQGNHCDYSFYLIFQRKQTGAKAFENFQSMKYEYQDINNLTISFINCYIDDLYKSEGYQVSNPRKIKTKD